MAYFHMAAVYDILMKDAPYQEWTDFAVKQFQEHESQISSVLDLGCGTGTITRLLASKGFQMTGIDNSETMLTIAQNRAAEEGISIQWMLQDIRELEGFQEIDAIVSFCDVLNYITEKQEISQVFSQANKVLKNNGLFIFDIHALQYVENNLQGQTFAEIYDDISYIWLCDAGEQSGEVYHDLTFFIREKELYERFDETHHQRTFNIEVYRDLLQENGFELVNLYGDFSYQPGISETTNRIFVVAKKSES